MSSTKEMTPPPVGAVIERRGGEVDMGVAVADVADLVGAAGVPDRLVIGALGGDVLQL